MYKQLENRTNIDIDLQDIEPRSKLTVLTDYIDGEQTIIAVLVGDVDVPAPKPVALPETGG